MKPAHICTPCRRRLALLPKLGPLQSYQRATFISLVPTELTSHTKGSAKETSSSDSLARRNSKIRQRNSNPAGQPKNKYPGFGQQASDVLESLFEESVKSSRLPAQKKTSAQYAAFNPYNKISVLNQMLEDGPTQLPAAWKYYLDHFGPDSENPSKVISLPPNTSLPAYISHSVQRLIRELINAKREDPFSSVLPSVAEITIAGYQVGMVRGHQWIQLMYGLLDGLMRTLQAEIPEYDQELDQRLVDDLLRSWNIMSRRTGIPIGPLASLLNWGYVPQFSDRNVREGIERNGAAFGFAYLIPKLKPGGLNGLAVVALATFFHMNHEERAKFGIAAGADSLNAALASIIHHVEIDRSILEVNPPRAPNTLIDFVEENWLDIKAKAAKVHEYYAADVFSPSDANPHHKGVYNRVKLTSYPEDSSTIDLGRQPDVAYINKRLHDAFLRRDFTTTNKLWGMVSDWPAERISEIDPATKIKTAEYGTVNVQLGSKAKNLLTLTLCNYFIMVFMGLHQPQRAIDVWNLMVNKDITPNIETWNSMLNGCKVARHWQGIESVWARLISMDIQPDEKLWVARISGLLACKKLDLGVEALDEMGRQFLEAAKAQYGDLSVEELRNKPVKNGVKPTISAVNATISGILAHPQPSEELVKRVLAWAAKLGITPNIFTYNTLLRPLAREGRVEEASAILKVMQEQGIRADIVTFTTILDETFRNTEQLTPDEQREMTHRTFIEMEAAGVKANLHTYGKIIHHLLQGSHTDMNLVNAVLKRMEREGIRATSVINTTLAKYFFEQNPPDLDGVRGLLDRVSREPGSVDYIFWNEIVEGYARAGDTVSAVTVIRQQDATGNRLRYRPIQVLLVALVKRGERDIAKNIVRDIKSQKWAQVKDKSELSRQAHDFWAVVNELGLLQDDKVPQ